MDIIAAHQQGLIERLAEESVALAGRPSDFAQRAVVLHHLYDHSGGGHGWALLEARRQLSMGKAILRLRRKAERLWLAKRRQAALEALDRLVMVLGEDAQRRCIAAYRAYRMTATQALETEAATVLPPALAQLHGECHARRRAGLPLSIVMRMEFASIFEDYAAGAGTDEQTVEVTDQAWASLAATAVGRAAQRALRVNVDEAEIARAERRGWDRIAHRLRADRTLPASFRANPAQHFFALQHGLAEKKRKQLCDAFDANDDTVALAA